MPIQFAGLMFSWTREYAKSYADKLIEMGFMAKVFELPSKSIVAYSYREFTRLEAEDALSQVLIK